MFTFMSLIYLPSWLISSIGFSHRKEIYMHYKCLDMNSAAVIG